MRSYLIPVKRILLQLLLLLSCYFVSRCAFALINHAHFEGLTLGGFLNICFHALRYDISALLAINALYIVLLLLPLPLWKIPKWEPITQWIFILTNTFALMFEVSDWAYFKFNLKRSTADVLNMVSRKGDFLVLLPRFILDYWYVPLCFIVLLWLFIKINNKIRRATPLVDRLYNIKVALGQLAILIVTAGLCLIGIRGGLQYVPIGVRNAVQATDPKFVPLVINTPFSIINTFENDALEDVHYFPSSELPKYFNATKEYTDNGSFKPKNVVVIIVESLSKEFTRLGEGKSYTPFIDSLMDEGLVCTQAYANALHSAEGIPAVVAGLPSLMDEPISTSIYSTEHITSLPNTLKTMGYSSAFYHGGTNGTMSFDVFCADAGFDKYFGRTEYHDEDDYDGNWGIWDEPFLQYFADGLGKMKPPFFATVFTLSSHPPYKLPPQYETVIPADSFPMHRSIAYTDIALRKFFEKAAHEPWYKNTLFVLTADHCSPVAAHSYYEANMGAYAIPIVYYAPGDSTLKGNYDKLTQQIDILPSVLNYLGYTKPFFAFGKSIFNKKADRFTVNYINGSYQVVRNNYLLQSVYTQPRALFSFPADSLCRNNLKDVKKDEAKQMLDYLKAFIQVYHSSVIHNQLWLETKK